MGVARTEGCPASTKRRRHSWTESELLGRSYPLVPAEKQEEFRGYLETVLRDQSFTDVETQRRTREGSVVDVQISVARSMTRPGA
jgi:hypothetical protein